MATKRRTTSTPARATRATAPTAPAAQSAVTLDRAGLRLTREDGNVEVLPIRAGAAHYWRLDRRAWRPSLGALVSMELKLVETYVPWQVHERDGEDGASPRYVFDGNLDVAAFLREAHALGLRAIVRPGPHINAELTDFGLPERVLWDPDCQAKTPRQNPVLLPAPPRAFPVPSYASKKFLAETARWFSAVGEQLRDLMWPKGPIVLLQIDNEGALYFRDGTYDQDYHPDALALYRDFLRERYGTIGELRRAYGSEIARFEDVAPPHRYDVRSAEDLPRHLDWAESHEVLLAKGFSSMADSLREAGLSGVPLFHNLPMGESATPLHPALVRGSANGSRGLDLIALDYYHTAGDHRAIARRSSELALSCESLGHPSFAAEMGAGAPPFFPPLDERDAAFTLLCAMAYGVRGYNVYMAVERDRWLGSPIDRDGVMRPFSAFFRKVGAAHDRIAFHTLTRDVPARIVVPRAVRRLARVMHAFGPISQALFRVMGAGMRETVLEDGIDFGEGHTEAPPMRAGRALVTVERALEEEGVPYAMVDGGDADVALQGARFVLVPTSCGLDSKLIAALSAAQQRGASITFAPALPTRDGSFRPLPPKQQKLLPDADVLTSDQAFDVAAVRHHLQAPLASVPRVVARPFPCAVTVHRDDKGAPRAVFVVNPTPTRQRVEASAKGVARIRDLLDGSMHVLAEGVAMEPSSVRFCEALPT